MSWDESSRSLQEQNHKKPTVFTVKEPTHCMKVEQAERLHDFSVRIADCESSSARNLAHDTEHHIALNASILLNSFHAAQTRASCTALART